MNRINPLYIGLSLLLIIVFVSYKLNLITDEYVKSKEEYRKTLSLAEELKSLKSVYDDKDRYKKSLRKILRHSSLKNSNIKEVKGTKTVKLSSDNMDKKAINFLMGKILNDTYQIKSMKITRLNDLNVSLEMELVW